LGEAKAGQECKDNCGETTYYHKNFLKFITSKTDAFNAGRKQHIFLVFAMSRDGSADYMFKYGTVGEVQFWIKR